MIGPCLPPPSECDSSKAASASDVDYSKGDARISLEGTGCSLPQGAQCDLDDSKDNVKNSSESEGFCNQEPTQNYSDRDQFPSLLADLIDDSSNDGEGGDELRDDDPISEFSSCEDKLSELLDGVSSDSCDHDSPGEETSNSMLNPPRSVPIPRATDSDSDHLSSQLASIMEDILSDADDLIQQFFRTA